MKAANKKGSGELPNIAAKDFIDSRKLYYFYHAASCGRFTIAEAVLGVAQSAISRQIQVLESDLGVQLLERTGHGVRLTKAGKIVYKHASEILDQMSDVKRDLEITANEQTDQVALAGPPSFMTTYAPEIVIRFRQMYPHVKLSVVEAATGNLLAHLVDGAVDLAIVVQIPKSTKLEVTTIAEEDVYFTAAPDHPVITEGVAKREHIPEYNLILPASLLGTKTTFLRYFEEGGIDISSQLQIDSLPLMKRLLLEGPYCALMGERSCRELVQSRELQAVPLDPPLKRNIYLVHLKKRPLSPEANALAELVTTIAGSDKDRMQLPLSKRQKKA
jgi:LysR family nitrogen assimilation transcriptional regulator